MKWLVEWEKNNEAGGRRWRAQVLTCMPYEIVWILRGCSYISVWLHRGLTYFACGDVDFFFFGVVLWSYLFVLGNWNWNWLRLALMTLVWIGGKKTSCRMEWQKGGDARIERNYILREWWRGLIILWWWGSIPLESGRWLDAGGGFFLFWNSNENEHTQRAICRRGNKMRLCGRSKFVRTYVRLLVKIIAIL